MSPVYINAILPAILIVIVIFILPVGRGLQVLFLFMNLCFTVFSVINTDKPVDNEKARELASCKMVEQNIYHGYFTENTNKLNCGGVIRNVTVSDYNNAIAMIKKEKS